MPKTACSRDFFIIHALFSCQNAPSLQFGCRFFLSFYSFFICPKKMAEAALDFCFSHSPSAGYSPCGRFFSFSFFRRFWELRAFAVFSVNWNSQYSPSTLRTMISPECMLITVRTMLRPRPTPVLSMLRDLSVL